jgi:hypothetical protein
MRTISLHLHQARVLKPLLFAVLLSSLGWALRCYAQSNEVLSLNMPPFLVVKQLTELGSAVVSLAVICWFLAFLVILPALVRTIRKAQSLLKSVAPVREIRSHMRSSATVTPPSYSSRHAAARSTSSQAG